METSTFTVVNKINDRKRLVGVDGNLYLYGSEQDKRQKKVG